MPTTHRERPGPVEPRSFFARQLHSSTMENLERLVAEERARVEAEYRRVLKTSVEFERRIRDRWREKNREKTRRIAELEDRIAELEQRAMKKDP